MAIREKVTPFRFVQLLAAQTIAADTWSSYVDTQGYQTVTIVVFVGTITSSSTNTLAITLQEANATPGTIASYSAVAAADLETGAASGLPTVDDSTEEATIYYVGYTGTERYVAVHLDETGTVSGPIAILAILGMPDLQPADGLTVTTGAIS